MFTLLRGLRIVLTQFFKGKLSSPLDAAYLPLRVMPWDCDLNLHINNGRYLSILDLARTQLYMATGIMPLLIGLNRWDSVVVSAHIVYRRSIDIFVKYQISSRFIGRTDKFLVIEHQFIVNGNIAVLAYVSVAFTKKAGLIKTDDFIDDIGLSRLKQDQRSEDLSTYLKTNEHFIDIIKQSSQA